MLRVLKTSGTSSIAADDQRYPTGELVRRLVALAWRFRRDCLWSLMLSVVLLLLGIAGLKLLGVVIDVIRYALDPSLPPPVYPFGWNPPAGWSALQIVTALALAIVAQAVLRAVLTYAYNMITARLTQGEIVPELRAQLYAKLQWLSFSFFDVHGSNSIFNRVTGDVQNTRLFVDGVLLQGMNMILTLAAYAVFMWRIHPALTLACLWVSAAVVVAGAFLFGAPASGLSAQPRVDGRHGAVVQRERARHADGEGLCRRIASSPAVRGGERPGVLATAENFLGFVRVYAGHADVVAVEPGDFVRVRRLAVCAGENTAGRRAGGVRGPAPAVHRTGGQHLDHREFGAAKSGGGAARVRGDGHTGGSAEPAGRRPAAPTHGPDGL